MLDDDSLTTPEELNEVAAAMVDPRQCARCGAWQMMCCCEVT